MNKKKKTTVLVLILAIILSLGGSVAATAAGETDCCKVGTAMKYAAKQLGLKPLGSGYAGYRKVLEQVDILQDGELPDTKEPITRAELALLACRVMDYLGESEDSIQVDRILEYGRVSDMEEAPKTLQRAVARVFGEGIIVGTADGWYRQTRTFRPDGTVTSAGMRGVIKKAMGKKERKPMSPDGQLIRTTDLPVNASEFDYILASFPNSFYELKFGYELSYFSRMPVSPKDYAAPVDVKNRNAGAMIEEWKYEWAELIKKNYELKLNFDYRTTDTERWIKELAATYNGRFDEERNTLQIERITEWVKWAKKNKVVIESEFVSVEPSMFHYSSGLSTQGYVRFRVLSCENFEANREKVIFTGSENCQIADVKLGKWYEDIIANGVAWYSLTPTGDTAGVRSSDSFCPFGDLKNDFYKKTNLMRPVKLSETNYGFEYID